MAHSAKKRSAGSSCADQCSRDKSNQEHPSMSQSYSEISSSDPERKIGLSRVLGTDQSSSERQENAGSSGKRKQSRWDAPQTDEQNVDDVVMTKRRKTRWSDDESQLKMLGPIHLPELMKYSINTADGTKVLRLNQQLLDINAKLQLESIDEKLRKKLVKKKEEIIREWIHKNPTFESSAHFEAKKFTKKLYVPVKEYPEYNFIGLILGPRGRTQQRMESETGARIMLRGKGSKKDGQPDPSDDEDLHVLIEADSQNSLDAAMAMVEKLLVPVEDGKNVLKHSQLRELAELNNTLRGENTHKTGDLTSKTDCGDHMHHHVSCPSRLPEKKLDETNFLCNTCGDTGHHSVACPFSGKLLPVRTHENNMGIFSALGCGSSPFTVPALGNQPFAFRPAVNSVELGGDKINKDADCTNLYVGFLPQSLDTGMLVQLFSPFGALSSVQVIRDKATGLSKGYGFVKYIDATSAAMAVNQMNGHRIDGKTLAVRVAGKQHGTPGGTQPVESTSARFPPAHPGSSAVAHIPATARWPGPPRSMLPETYGQLCTSYGSSYTNQIPSSLISTHDPTSEELARFPGNPDNFASDYPSLFS